VVVVLVVAKRIEDEDDDENEKDMVWGLSSCRLLQVLRIPSSLNFDF